MTLAGAPPSHLILMHTGATAGDGAGSRGEWFCGWRACSTPVHCLFIACSGDARGSCWQSDDPGLRRSASVKIDPCGSRPHASPGPGIAPPRGHRLRLSGGSPDPGAGGRSHPTGIGRAIPSRAREPAAPAPGWARQKTRTARPPTGPRGGPGLAGAAVSRAGIKRARVGTTIVFVDEAAFVLLPFVVRTDAPRGAAGVGGDRDPRASVDVTGDPIWEGRLTQRLKEIGNAIGPDFVPVVRGGR